MIRGLKYTLAIAFVLLNIPEKAYSNTVNTTSNSSGSVTNQSIQVVPSRQFSSSVGPSIQCQGSTLNINPFLQTTNSYGEPFEPTYNEPVYDLQTNDDGALINPGSILYYKPVRTGQKQNNMSISSGIAMTFAIPLDREQIRLCKSAMKKQVQLYEHSLESKKLNYHASRINTCAKWKKEGVLLTENSPLFGLCKDVNIVNPPNTLPDHAHEIESVTIPFSAFDERGLNLFESSASEGGLTFQETFSIPSPSK